MHAEDFIQFLASEKHYSPHTIAAYKNDLAQFHTFSISNYDLVNAVDLDHQVIRSWLAHMVESGVSARSARRKLSTLKSYFRFLLKRGLIRENPMQKIIAPRASQKLPVFVGKDKMERLFELISTDVGFIGIRNRLVMEMLYATGMRVSELISIKHKDISMEAMTLIVTGKRNKQRIIPFGSQLLAVLKDYLVIKEEQFGIININDYLITTVKGKLSYPRLIYNIVTRNLLLVTTQTKKSPHVIRHSFATGMLNNGADLNAIKELLGHSSLAATQVYTHNTIERIKHIYQQAHPKA
jgi:integrase/recombinase XerC